MGLRLSDPINDLDNVDQFHEGLFVFAMCGAGISMIVGIKAKKGAEKKKRLEKQRAKQRDSDSTSSTSTGRGSIASMAIVMMCFLAALLSVLTQLGSVSLHSFPWSGILLFLLAEMSSERNQVRSCI